MFDKRHWFVREVTYWRLGASLAWYLLILPGTATLFLFLINFTIYSPFQWISGWLSWVFSSSFFILVFLVGCCNFWMSLYNAYWFEVRATVHKTRWSVILSISKPIRLLYTLVAALSGGFTIWCLTAAMGSQYTSLGVPCSADGADVCLNEHHLMLVLFGVYMGIVHSISHFLYGNNVLHFPVLKQLKFFLVKSHIFPSFFEALRSSFKHVVYFYLLYIVLGCVPRDWLEANLKLDYSISQLESVYNLFDLTFFWYMLISGAFLHHLWHFALFLMKIFVTEVYEFPMEAALIEQDEACLDKILSTPSPFVKYQAFQDLQDLSEHSKRRRGWIYSLSQPGGHPHRWNRVCTQCLELLDSLTNQLLAHHNQLTNGKLQQKYSATEQISTLSSNGSTIGKTLTASSQLTAPSPGSPVLYSPSRPQANFEVTENYGSDSVFSSSYVNGQYPNYGGQLRRRPIHTGEFRNPEETPRMIGRRGALDRLKQFRLVKYLLEPLPDSASRDLFIDCQLHIWAVEALSALVISSLQEDTYGVVQQTLPAILMSMMSLSNFDQYLIASIPLVEVVEQAHVTCFDELTCETAIEKHLKFLSMSKDGRQRSDLLALSSSGSVARLRGGLQGSLKTALHGTIATFGYHLSNIALPPDYSKQLSHLMEYKE